MSLTGTNDAPLPSALLGRRMENSSLRPCTIIPFYTSPNDLPPHLPKVRSSGFTKIEPLGVQTVHVTYESSPGDTKHKVAGFTTAFVPGDTVLDNFNRTIDHLNLKLGIVHRDITTWNLLINPETDDLQIFDFNMGAKLTWEGDNDHLNTFGYDEDRNDVKLAVFAVYEIITSGISYREENELEDLDVAQVLDQEEWEQHPDVQLEEGVPVSEYRRVLMEWVSSRKKDREGNYVL
ncbi:hypothetical protein QC762_401740 [Podospora pseudocomata]|uniref:non-specific serine/threonine protein kinase n=1 Tax=Podospora pseudocomata TaxID=2093779 RepID=A0ABR0GEK7_9PEZI|nr:hypothetical protein QC762_401740 [Podospora pseudocomata]